ncbi:MAG: fibronectin type III domain-containing protein, partial [Candidatus Peregrinibacteria bacterium]
APAAEGQYPVDVVLSDRLGNKAELLNQRTIKVISPEPQTPPQVEGLSGESGDDSVTLTWNAIAASGFSIDHYRVYYGAVYDKLDKTLDTPGAVTGMTVGNLTNGQQSFFAVKAVDAKAAESKDLSVTIAVTPVAPSLPVSPAPSSSLQATPLNGGVALNWYVTDATSAFYYKIYFGLKSGQYDDFVLVRGDRAATTVPDLINGATYYFAMVPLDAAGQELGGFSTEVSATPGETGFYGAAPELVSSVLGGTLKRVPYNEATGPESLWVIGASVLLAAFVYSQKRKHFKR